MYITGELTVYCKGPHKNAFCELREEYNGTYTMILTPQDVGIHDLHIQFDGTEVPGTISLIRMKAFGSLRDRMIGCSSYH